MAYIGIITKLLTPTANKCFIGIATSIISNYLITVYDSNYVCIKEQKKEFKKILEELDIEFVLDISKDLLQKNNYQEKDKEYVVIDDNKCNKNFFDYINECVVEIESILTSIYTKEDEWKKSYFRIVNTNDYSKEIEKLKKSIKKLRGRIELHKIT